MGRSSVVPAKRGRSKRLCRVAGLFAGIGGIELGLHLAGHRTELLCELDESARAVLGHHFPNVTLASDIRDLHLLPAVDLVTAGFPCQDLSQAGKTAGIGGTQSGLVGEVFRLIEQADARWLLLENVPFMLQLDKGKAMRFLTAKLDELGFAWAYRTVDARSFGLPQRRQRVLLLASRTHDPREVLLSGEGTPPATSGDAPCGFYWTEGTRGLGWAVDAVPTLKGGSTIGIPSPPAIWMRHAGGAIVQPEIRDAERLQGFPADWTLPATGAKKGARWKLVGNAVAVPMARWVGERLKSPTPYDGTADRELGAGDPWPDAAWGDAGRSFAAPLSRWPVTMPYQPLAEFLHYPTVPLSERATAGFLRRARASCLRFADGFLEAVAAHLEGMKAGPEVGPPCRGGPAATSTRRADPERHDPPTESQVRPGRADLLPGQALSGEALRVGQRGG
jgi:DNA (cytosine-5)-methyltransferase 1